MNRELLVEKLTAEKFKKFGDVVEPKDNPLLINKNKCERHNDLAFLQVSNCGHVGVSIFASEKASKQSRQRELRKTEQNVSTRRVRRRRIIRGDGPVDLLVDARAAAGPRREAQEIYTGRHGRARDARHGRRGAHGLRVGDGDPRESNETGAGERPAHGLLRRGRRRVARARVFGVAAVVPPGVYFASPPEVAPDVAF